MVPGSSGARTTWTPGPRLLCAGYERPGSHTVGCLRTEQISTQILDTSCAEKSSAPRSKSWALNCFLSSDSGSGTLHANAAAQVPARLEALGTAAGLDRAALHSQLAAALSVVLHLVRDRAGRRRIAEVHVLERDPSGLVVTVPALRWGEDAFAYERGWARLRELLRDGSRGRCGPTRLGTEEVLPDRRWARSPSGGRDAGAMTGDGRREVNGERDGDR